MRVHWLHVPPESTTESIFVLNQSANEARKVNETRRKEMGGEGEGITKLIIILPI